MSRHGMEWGGVLGPDVPVRMLGPSKTRQAAPGKSFVSTDLVRRLEAMPPGSLWLLSRQFERLGDVAAVGRIDTVREMAHGRHESRRGVAFGQLVLQGEVFREQTEQVAAKPTAPYLAAREFGAMNAVNAAARARGRAGSFEPLGFYRGPEQENVSLVTRYDHPVRTLDLILWDKEKRPGEQEVCAALSQCAFALGNLHADGIAWGDAQPKNVGVDSRGVRQVDLEAAHDFAVAPGVTDPFRVRRLVESDLDTLLRTLDGDYRSLVPARFAAPYHATVGAGNSRVPAEALIPPGQIAEIAAQPQYDIARFSV